MASPVLEIAKLQSHADELADVGLVFGDEDAM